MAPYGPCFPSLSAVLRPQLMGRATGQPCIMMNLFMMVSGWFLGTSCKFRIFMITVKNRVHCHSHYKPLR